MALFYLSVPKLAPGVDLYRIGFEFVMHNILRKVTLVDPNYLIPVITLYSFLAG